MPIELKLPALTEEIALGRLLAWLRQSKKRTYPPDGRPDYGHDLYLPNLVLAVLDEVKEEHIRQHPVQGMQSYQFNMEIGAEPFYRAAWSLRARGILAPAPVYPWRQKYGEQVIGGGFSLTDYGHQWLAQPDGLECVPTEYARFGQLLAGHASRFGAGYHGRSQEAVRCYQAHTYLACCAMCGAAAESVLLALAIAKKGDEEEVLREYKSANGRGKVERLLTGQQTAAIQQDFATYTTLLKYWRDEAAHGTVSPISEEEAFTSLLLLLRFARFATDRWAELTKA